MPVCREGLVFSYFGRKGSTFRLKRVVFMFKTIPKSTVRCSMSWVLLRWLVFRHRVTRTERVAHRFIRILRSS